MEERDEKSSLSEIGEFGLIARIIAGAPAGHFNRLMTGPGDDCAVLDLADFCGGKGYLLITTDALVEERHFSLKYSSFFDVGWKSLAVSISDIAAMGGEATTAVIALQARPDLEVEQLDEFYRGAYEIAGRHGVSISGGDTVASDVFAVTFTVLGICGKKPVLRSGALAEEDLWVTGEIGGAGAGLRLLQAGSESELTPNTKALLFARHSRPEPRSLIGRMLLDEGLASAMIDVSDGLLQDARHLAQNSKVDIVIDTASVPLSEGVLSSGLQKRQALVSGDDYELLFTAPRSARPRLMVLGNSDSWGAKVSLIGGTRQAASTEADVYLFENGASERVSGGVLGYEHFNKR